MLNILTTSELLEMKMARQSDVLLLIVDVQEWGLGLFFVLCCLTSSWKPLSEPSKSISPCGAANGIIQFCSLNMYVAQWMNENQMNGM